MFLSFNWLKDLVALPANLKPEELGDKLTLHTVEVEGVKREADKFKGVVVGRIESIDKHPNADRLQSVKVNIGSGENLSIVCGAANIKPGQLVPVALVGTTLANGAEIREVEVRGIMSSGMLCAEDELGLGEDHAGIMILDESAKIGDDFGYYLKLKDVIFEVDNKSITHRPDLWSHYGIAREIAAFSGAKLKDEPGLKALPKTQDGDMVKVRVEDQALCPRYMALRIDGIKVEESPKWLQDRLISVGLRPINNIVDITNFVMLELGQPLHAFDSALVGEIVVRNAKEGESIETLDGEQRELDKEMLVIADSGQAIAIAGVMGGVNSEISEHTDSIIIESATFDFISIRNTSKKLGLRTEASMRFEKGLDPNLAEKGLRRTAELVLEICPAAKLAAEPRDIKNYKLNTGPIELSVEWAQRVIGARIDVKEIIAIFSSLGFGVLEKDGLLKINVPTWRATRDIAIKEDLIEELARVYGYNRITPDMPNIKITRSNKNRVREEELAIKKILTGAPAMNEVYNYSFVGEEVLKKLGVDFSSHIRLKNPVSKHQTLLRQSLVTNLFQNVVLNQPRFDDIRLFEFGDIYSSVAGEIDKSDRSEGKLPYQERRLGLLCSGAKENDVYDILKGAIQAIIDVSFLPLESVPAWSMELKTARIDHQGKDLGYTAMLDTKIARKLGIKQFVAVAEIGCQELTRVIEGKNLKMKEISKYPPVVRDLAFVVNESSLYGDIKEAMTNFHELIESVELFDVYRGESIGQNRKNLAFHVLYRSESRTLTAGEVDDIQSKLVEFLKQRFDASIRDF